MIDVMGVLGKKNLPLQSYQEEKSGMVPLILFVDTSANVIIVLGALRTFRRNG